MSNAYLSGLAAWGVGLLPLDCWDYGFESCQGMGVCLLWVLCVVRKRFLRRADYLYIGVLPSVLCPKIMITKSRKGRIWPGIRSPKRGGKESLPNYLHGYLYCCFFEHFFKPNIYTSLYNSVKCNIPMLKLIQTNVCLLLHYLSV
jgi:hypothetical protein